MQLKDKRSSWVRKSKYKKLTISKRRKLMTEKHKSWGMRIQSSVWHTSIPEKWNVMVVIGLLMSAADARTWEKIAVKRRKRVDWWKGLVLKASYLIPIQVNWNAIRARYALLLFMVRSELKGARKIIGCSSETEESTINSH